MRLPTRLEPQVPDTSMFGNPDEHVPTEAYANQVNSDLSPLAQALTAAGLIGAAKFNGPPAATPPPGYNYTPGYSNYVQKNVVPPWVTDPRQVPYPQTYYTGASADMADDRVYMGHEVTLGPTETPHHMGELDSNFEEPKPGRQKAPTSITVQQALNRPYTWDDNKINDVMAKMRHAGLSVDNFQDMTQAWEMLVTRASKIFGVSRGKREVSPWDVLSTVKKENVANGVLDKEGNIVQKSVNKTVSDISNADAWATLRSAMTSSLGRKPTDDEVREFAARANEAAQQDPTVTTTRSVTNADTGQSSSTSHSTGGFTGNDAAQMATDQLENTDEYARYQSATTYTNALLGALDEVAGGMS